MRKIFFSFFISVRCDCMDVLKVMNHLRWCCFLSCLVWCCGWSDSLIAFAELILWLLLQSWFFIAVAELILWLVLQSWWSRGFCGPWTRCPPPLIVTRSVNPPPTPPPSALWEPVFVRHFLLVNVLHKHVPTWGGGGLDLSKKKPIKLRSFSPKHLFSAKGRYTIN